MATTKATLLDDPRYPAFVARYYGDALAFAVEVCGMIPSEDQSDMLTEIAAPAAKVSVVSGTGCFAAGTQMMRRDGRAIAVEDIRVGDKLMGPDGNSERSVLELRRGRETMYRFTYVDGSSHVFNESHILCLVNTYDKNGRKAGDLCNVTVRDYLGWNATRRRSHAIYRSAVTGFGSPAKSTPIPPYVLGVWLGDGTSAKPEIHSPDEEVLDAWRSYVVAAGCLLHENQRPGCISSFGCRVGTTGENPITAALEAIGVFKNKHIPDSYLYGSLDDRRELVAGLIDTDGHYDHGSGGYDWIQKNELLAHQFCWLVRSIGCHATIRKVRKGCQTGAVGDYWRVTIGRNVASIPCRIPRKRRPADLPIQRDKLQFSIRSVEPLGDGDYFGFVLDGDSRFLGHDFTVLHNTGKTNSVGRIVLWHLLCRPYAFYEGKVEIGSNTYVGAARLQQVADGVWKEASDADLAIAGGEFAWLRDYYTITKTKMFVNGFDAQWFVSQMAMGKGESIGVAGRHRMHQLIIVDEAAGVQDSHYDVIEGTQTQAMNATLLLSQGVKAAGYFYRTHHDISIDAGGSWVSLRFNSEDSPFVTNEWLAAREQESGGRDSLEYMVRVLGLFAHDESKFLLNRSQIEACFHDNPIIRPDEPFGYMTLADVGLGELRDESVAMVAKVTGSADHGEDARRVEYIDVPLSTNTRNEIDFTGDLIAAHAVYENSTLYVDSGGIGSAVCRLIERSNVQVERVNWGKPCFRREDQDRFFNQRACAMVKFRDAVKQGRVRFSTSIPKRIRDKIIDQCSKLPYFFSESGGLKYQMEKKEVMREQMGIKSPDHADAASFVFLPGAGYIERQESSTREQRMKAKVVDQLSEMLEAALGDLAEEPSEV